MPNELTYVGAGQSDFSDIRYATISSIPYIFEGYSHVKVQFSCSLASIIEISIKINGNVVYEGADYSDKYYNVTVGSNIEAYMLVRTSGCDSSNPSVSCVTVIAYK